MNLWKYRQFFLLILCGLFFSSLGYAEEQNLACAESCFLPQGRCARRGLFSIGGGYYDAGPRHSGSVFQLEYKWSKYFFRWVRPQMTLFSPGLKSAFIGLGVGFEMYLGNQFILTPSFEPGIYFQGRGRNLGYPVEFRSGLEFCFENKSGMRLGTQVFHISNASLSKRNPGANALLFFVAFPH